MGLASASHARSGLERLQGPGRDRAGPRLFFFLPLFDKFHMLHFINLKSTACYFDTCIYYNMIAIEAMFITSL